MGHHDGSREAHAPSGQRWRMGRGRQIFTLLMGEPVEPRREFIEKHARVATLDVWSQEVTTWRPLI